MQSIIRNSDVLESNKIDIAQNSFDIKNNS